MSTGVSVPVDLDYKKVYSDHLSDKHKWKTDYLLIQM
jgi:hypothetical protein